MRFYQMVVDDIKSRTLQQLVMLGRRIIGDVLTLKLISFESEKNTHTQIY
jgi:hypothetical protein